MQNKNENRGFLVLFISLLLSFWGFFRTAHGCHVLSPEMILNIRPQLYG